MHKHTPITTFMTVNKSLLLEIVVNQKEILGESLQVNVYLFLNSLALFCLSSIRADDEISWWEI